jgi:hypothetical protein
LAGVEAGPDRVKLTAEVLNLACAKRASPQNAALSNLAAPPNDAASNDARPENSAAV